MFIKIGKHSIGNDHPCFIIAEIGGNHGNDPKFTLQLIDESKKAGANAVKFQLYRADSIIVPRDNLLPTYNYFKSVELPLNWIPKLYKYTTKLGMEFLCTPFYPQAVKILDRLGTPAMKIASGDITNTRLLKLAACTKKPVILSTGMSYIREVKQAVKIICAEGNKRIIVLHCVSIYPTNTTDVHLRAMTKMGRDLKLLFGLSDHTPGIGIPIAAVTLGASVIEKHVTVDKTLPGMDHSFALDFREFKQMVDEIRQVEQALGKEVKKPVKAEMPERKWARRAVYPIVDIRKNIIINESMIDTLRPNIGISAYDFYKVIGKRTKKDIKAKHSLFWKDLMNIVIIIQARINSSRLPRKVTKTIEGHPLLWHVWQRAKKIKPSNKIIIATGVSQTNDWIRWFCSKHSITCFSGSDDDVLDRYYQAAKKYNGDIIVRIMADCPLLDPQISSRVVLDFIKSGAEVGGISGPFPNGVDTEAFTFKALEIAARNAVLHSEREHVTPYMHHHLILHETIYKKDLYHLKLSVDRHEDLKLVRRLFSALYKQNRWFGIDEVTAYIDRHTELLKINRQSIRGEGYRKSLEQDYAR